MKNPRAKPPTRWSFVPMLMEKPDGEYGRVIRMRTPADVVPFCADMQISAVEMFVVFLLNGKNNVVNRVIVSMGLMDASLVHPREVFRAAIRNDPPVGAVILAHNHPSGDPNPSAEDIRITRQLIEAGRIVDIKVLDHVIIGRPNREFPAQSSFISLRESGVINFD